MNVFCSFIAQEKYNCSWIGDIDIKRGYQTSINNFNLKTSK